LSAGSQRSGSEFQTVGPATEKAQRSKLESTEPVEGALKMQDRKMKDHDVSEKGLYKMSGHQERLLKAAQQLVNRLKSSTIAIDRPTYFITVV